MRHVFDPDQLTLTEASADPRRVFELQGQVRELIEASPHRADVLEHEIEEQGAWALPGLVNALLVWSDLLDGNILAQDRLAGLMLAACRGNDAAVDILMRAGVLECPFPLPRSIARRVLESLGNWRPTSVQVSQLRVRRSQLAKFHDHAGEVDILALLLRSNTSTDYDEALARCKHFLPEAHAGQLFAMLVAAKSDRAQDILIEIINSGTAGTERRRRAEAWIDPLSDTGLLPVWLQDGTLLSTSVAVVTGKLSNKAVERLWRLSLRDYFDGADSIDTKMVERLTIAVKKTNSEVLCRYWFMSLAGVNKGLSAQEVVDYLGRQLQGGGYWAIQAAVQLMFLRNRGNPVASQTLQDLERSDPELCRLAQDTLAIMGNNPPPPLPPKPPVISGRFAGFGKSD